MYNTKLNEKIQAMEEAGTTVIELAHYLVSAQGVSEKQWRSRDLLVAARAYAHKVNAVVRHKAS